MMKEIFGEDGLLSEVIDNYKFREGQLSLASAVWDALLGGHHLLADAPTGTGKSMAYGIPASIHALDTGRPVVIVTANITLQEQLIGKDLPLISSALSGAAYGSDGNLLPDLKFALVKGMSNYLCKDKVEELKEKGTDEEWFDEIFKWAGTTDTGDKSELEVEYEPKIWQRVSCAAEECGKGMCKFEESCFALSSRNTSGVHVIVTNYHMYYTDLLVRQHTAGHYYILPSHDVVVMDEAHEAVDIAQAFGGFEIGPGRFRWLTGAMRNLHEPAVEPLMRSVVGCAERFFASLSKISSNDIIRRPLMFDGGLVQALNSASKQVGKIAGIPGISERHEARAITLSGSLMSTSVKVAEAALGEAKGGGKSQLPEGRVYYVEHTRDGSSKLCCKQVEVQDFLREHIFIKKTLIAVSATLASGGSFKFIGGELGLAPSEYRSLVVDSPFDPKRLMFMVPKGVPTPKERERHMMYVAEAVHRIITDLRGKTMALFTSYKSLNATANYLSSRAKKGMKVLVQGELPKSRIIELFKSSNRAVILGTASFWQGVDIPGQALSCLLIDKFPFIPPSDPVLKYMEDKAQFDGGHAFFDYSIPKAMISLKQGVGRLIRTEDDYGVVVLCDNRIDSTGYGKQFVKVFPGGCYRSNDGDLDDVKHFLESMGGS